MNRYIPGQPQDLFPLFIFPFAHIILLGLFGSFLAYKPCKNYLAIVLTFLVLVYIQIAYWGFQHEERVDVITIGEQFKEDRGSNKIYWS